MRAVDLIAGKRDGGEIPTDQLREFVLAYAREELPDYQMAAFLMAGYLRGFTRSETEALTEAMVASGDQLDLGRLSGPTVDKHSTGGVADGTTLVVGPLAAALGMQVIKLSGRGLGHTGGTLDKLESIPGFRVGLGADELLDQVERIGLAVAAQTADLVPADKSIYALRDVTATVGNVSLIASSVMSKKLAGGAASILLDVKTGSGAFMHETAEAVELARICVDLGQAAGRGTAALVTDMDQPLGELIGNAVEVREAVEALRGERPGRFLDLCLTLTGHMAALAGTAADPESGRRDAQRALEGGDGLERFREFVAAQGGDPRVADDLSILPQAPHTLEVEALSGRLAGGGRRRGRRPGGGRPGRRPPAQGRRHRPGGGRRALGQARRPGRGRPADRAHPGPRRGRRPRRRRRPAGHPQLERPAGRGPAPCPPGGRRLKLPPSHPAEGA